MSLAELLTPTRLRTLAGYSYTRGVEYFRTGRVGEFRAHGDRIEGVVAGSDDYRVAIFLEDEDIYSECTCPVGGRGELCKHAVALALTYLSPRDEPAKVPEEAGPVFATNRELDTWCADNGVSHELAIAADALGPTLHEMVPSARGVLPFVLARWCLRDVASLENASRYLGVQSLRRAACEAAHRYLARAAADVVVARDEESQPRPVPDEPALQALWAKLLELRGPIRRQASPRSRAMRATGSLTYDRKDTRLVWTEPTQLQIVNGTFLRAAVECTLSVLPAVTTTCACKKTHCTHVLALIDSCLDLLADVPRRAEARTIADELLRPPWQRALAELAAAEDRATKVRPEIEVWWLIDVEMGGFTLTPLVKKQLKKGGTSAGSRMSALRLLDDHADALSEQDLAIAQHLAAWQPGRRGSTYPARAFATLVGHARVALDEDSDAPISVRRLPLGFTAVPAGDDIRLEPTVDGARFSPRLLAPLLQMFASGEPVVVVENEQGRCTLVDVTDEARRLWNVLAKYGDTFPQEGQDQLMARLAQIDRAVPIAIPEALLGARVADSTMVVVRLRLTFEGTLELEPFIRPAPGAPLFPAGTGPRDVIVRNGERAYARRNLDAEAPLVAAMLARLPLEAADPASERS